MTAEGTAIACPFCDTKAVYKYGRTSAGKQRFLCLICGRQFTPGAKKTIAGNRPTCPSCGKPMHRYKNEDDAVRFRCSHYPDCKTFIKITRKEGDPR
ncbi:MAG: topoisomerase DNA-binding C4 zinc finger domain-containing protein [Nitrospirae bacterium]|nr:topoisomerase DNA-binding C4 zinc finger domain-containing protein [Nitrospirota bacterium]